MLNGEWDNPTNGTPDIFGDDLARSFPSGDGAAGGRFQFFFSHSPGDYNQDGAVDTADSISWHNSDGDGDGIVGGQGDYDVYRAHVGNILPVRRNMGDYNDNEIVNGGDYVVWRSMFGVTGTGLAADGNWDGSIDAADYDVWRANWALRSAWYTESGDGGPPVPLSLLGVAPQVLNVTMSGSNSTHNPYSFASVDGSGEQLRTVPIGGIDSVSMTFSEEVLLLVSDLTLTGLQSQSIPSVSEFTYDPFSQTATWRFEDPLAAGQYLMRLSDAVVDLDGDLLDGEFTNPWALSEAAGYASTFPSGDGEAGGEFRFRFTNLAGDFSHDNIAGTSDYSNWNANYPTATGAIHADGDADGDGDVDTSDYAVWNAQVGIDYSAWPSVEPGMILVSNAIDESDANYTLGDLSLREALAIAATNAGTDTIAFQPSIGQILLSSELTINSDVNIVGDGAGGLTIDAQGTSRAFTVSSGVTAEISGLTITGGGNVTHAGAIYVDGNLTLDSVVVEGNTAASRGGAIYVLSTGTLHVENSTIDNNSSAAGGGIYVASGVGETLTIKNSTISNNTSTGTGGGVTFTGASTGDPRMGTIVNSTISGNTATSSGGIRVRYDSAELTIINSTITDNEATTGRGGGALVLDGARLTLHNSILAGNEAAIDADDLWKQSSGDFNPTISSNNLIGAGNSSGLTHGVNGNKVGSTASPLNPGLTGLGNYGGLTKTHALLDGSLAIDSGDDSKAIAFDLLLDQRGEGRIDDGDGDLLLLVDIGAFELAADEYFGSV